MSDPVQEYHGIGGVRRDAHQIRWTRFLSPAARVESAERVSIRLQNHITQYGANYSHRQPPGQQLVEERTAVARRRAGET
jgi:hypothetical protein